MRAAFGLNFNEAEAEELVQATFCAYLEGGARFEEIPSADLPFWNPL